jgi:hypothetical protein
MVATRPATTAEAIAARDQVLERIAELEPKVKRLKAAQRALGTSYRKAKLEAWDAAIELKHMREYLFALATGVADGSLVMRERDQ